MARPAAEVLLHRVIDDEHGLDILAADKMFVVVYKDQPINIRQVLWTKLGVTQYKYQRNGVPTEASAKNLAARLNRWFNCNDFTVKRVL